VLRCLFQIARAISSAFGTIRASEEFRPFNPLGLVLVSMRKCAPFGLTPILQYSNEDADSYVRALTRALCVETPLNLNPEPLGIAHDRSYQAGNPLSRALLAPSQQPQRTEASGKQSQGRPTGKIDLPETPEANVRFVAKADMMQANSDVQTLRTAQCEPIGFVLPKRLRM